ncbi:hypothetical protein [Brumimicrobium mesophilum]|uniref:hypothetical protein n=1 Tax=Brumimicrobium mesophilum TaxID=392717 RepID=UPI00131B5AB8|nr:hypothetical protein [Brumimicrobium mesophilum]
MKQFLIIFLSASLLAMTSACKKISTPNEESRELFGSWEYEYDSGGFSGAGGSTKYNSDSWIEFTERGFFKVYEGSNKESQKKYRIKMKESIYSSEEKPAIVYLNGDYEMFTIEDDKLYISDNHYDGFTYTFSRK